MNKQAIKFRGQLPPSGITDGQIEAAKLYGCGLRHWQKIETGEKRIVPHKFIRARLLAGMIDQDQANREIIKLMMSIPE